jgi:hypothetical protein
MPKKNEKSSLPLHLRNRLSNSTQPFWVVSEARSTLTEGQLRVFAKHTCTLASMGRPILPSLSAKRLKDFRLSEREMSKVILSKELAWIAGLLEAHADLLNKLLAIKLRVEDLLLDGQFEGAIAALDLLEREGGVSLFSIETRQGVLQLSGGLSRQKEYLKVIRNNREAGDSVAYIAFHGSIRNETTTQIFSFREHFSGKIESELSDSSFRTWLLFHICDRTPVDDKQAAELLRMEQSSSILDLFETYIRCATSLSKTNGTVFEKFVPTVKQLMSCIYDQRLNRLLTLSLTDAVTAIDTLAAQSFLIAAPDGKVDTQPEETHEARAASEPSDENDQVNGSLRKQIGHDLARLTGPEFDIRSFLRLMRIAANFRCTAVPSLFYVEAMDQVNQTVDKDKFALSFSFVYGQKLRPASLRLLPPEARKHLAMRMSALAPGDPALFLVQAELGMPAGTPPENLEESVIRISELSNLADQAQWSGIETAAKELVDDSNIDVRKDSARFLANALLNQGKVHETVEYIVSAVLSDEVLSYRLPISLVLSKIDKTYRRRFSSKLSTPIIFQLLRTRDSKTESFRTYAYEDFLTSNGAQRPSDLRDRWNEFNKTQVIYYLRWICTPETMQMSSFFSGTKEYEDERVSICSLLAELDPVNAKDYEAESSGITQHQVIRGGVKQVEENKIYVDVENIRQWADENLRESWSRYQALRAGGIGTTDTAVIEAIREALKKVSPGTLVLSLPENEATTLFVSMLDKLRNEFLSNPKHGLDCYLSMRVRHGSLAGHLRSPLESNRIITQRDSEDNSYKTNDYWAQRLNYLPNQELEIIDEHLKTFSRAFDLLIDEYTNSYVQIATLEKPNGLFFLTLSDSRIAVLAHALSLDAAFEDFVEGAFRLLSDQLDLCLSSVRGHVEAHLRPTSDEIFNKLEEPLASLGVSRVQELDAAVHAAHTELQQTIVQLTQWFHRSEPEKGPDFTFEELVKIGLMCVSRIHERFSPNVKVEAPAQDIVFSDLAFFSDVFFILFDNARIHSGLVNPEVKIRANVLEHFLNVEVRSAVAKDRNFVQICNKVEAIKATIQKGGYHKAVRSEGGTGLIKLRNILEWRPATDSMLDFEMDEAHGEFVVNLKVPLLLARRRLAEAS